jgi:hypothetical protein
MPPVRAVLVACAVCVGAAVAVTVGMDSLLNRPASAMTREEVASIAVSTVEHGDLPPGFPRSGWKATYVELEPGREFVLHFPGNHLVQRAPCMRPFNSTLFACSQAPIW